jgi:subfamily B ATP-binding cassette protein MsbA
VNTFRKLLVFVRPYRGRFSIALVAMAINSACTGLAALLVKNVLDDIFISKNVAMLRLVPLAIIIVYLLKGVTFFVHTYLMKYIGQAVIRDLRDRIFGHIMGMPLGFFHKRSTGSIMSRLINDVTVVEFAVTNTLASTIRDPLTIIALVVALIYRSPFLASLALIILPLAVFPLIRFGRSSRENTRKSQAKVSRMTTLLHEVVGGIRIVIAFGNQEYEKKRFRDENERFFQISLRKKRIEAVSAPVMELLGAMTLSGVVILGGSQVIRGTLTAGEFFSFLTAMLLFYEPFKRLTTVNNATQEALAAADRIFEVLDVESDLTEKPGAAVLPRVTGRIVLDGVSFGYGNQTVLHDINLAVRPGEAIAVVGGSGAGKSTLVSLIPRYYDVTGGSITVDGHDIRDVTLDSLRKNIAVVTQESILFNETVADNIAYGRQGATRAEIEAAAGAAYAHDFITGLPNGYETVIGERGVTLSGGERQRLCIARAILADAPILILDEATSSLDAESEQLVQKALDNLMTHRTTFVIAHRFGTILHADRILVIDGGTIVAEGRHQELLETNEIYRRLYRLQFRDQEA